MSFPQQNPSDNDENMKQREAQAEEMKQMILMKIIGSYCEAKINEYTYG